MDGQSLTTSAPFDGAYLVLLFASIADQRRMLESQQGQLDRIEKQLADIKAPKPWGSSNPKKSMTQGEVNAAVRKEFWALGKVVDDYARLLAAGRVGDAGKLYARSLSQRAIARRINCKSHARVGKATAYLELMEDLRKRTNNPHGRGGRPLGRLSESKRELKDLTPDQVAGLGESQREELWEAVREVQREADGSNRVHKNRTDEG